MTAPRLRCVSLQAAALAIVGFIGVMPAAPSAADDVLARSRAMYTSLRSYADTGTVDVEFGSSGALIRERHTFKTHYRAPRHFYFEFNEDKSAGADRFVIWGDAEAFHTWWLTTGVEQTFPKGQGAGAFTQGVLPTKRSLMQIPPLLFAGAGLVGTVTELGEASVTGMEDVGGQRCHKLIGVAKSVYPATGHETNIRRTTIWIDAETLLVRKVFEDTPRGTPAGTASRYTTIFNPQANPTIEDSRFKFTVPSVQK